MDRQPRWLLVAWVICLAFWLMVAGAWCELALIRAHTT